MHLAHLSLHDFRSWPDLDLALDPGAVCFVGRNGQGKTNLVEAVDYLARLGSHRVAADAPLVRQGADHAVVRAAVVREERRVSLEVQINPGKSNRAQVNRSPLPRPRELLGWVRTVLFAPDDLVLVKGDPSDRRHFLDDLAVQQQPRYAAVRADYERVLKQRNSLLKTAGAARRGGSGSGQRSGGSALATLEVWDQNLARLGAQMVATRLRLVAALRPHLSSAYAEVARGGQEVTTVGYRCSFLAQLSEELSEAELESALLAAVAERRRDELDRGISLVGPHRDDLLLGLGDLPVKGYASHGESWSYALALRLASFALLREAGDDPILILDDVFAELDSARRDQLATLAADAEQVLVTAAVEQDVPPVLAGSRYRVGEGSVTRE